ncbi:hypothetical protein ACT4US_22565, partial [Bacillus sp. HC-Mk]
WDPVTETGGESTAIYTGRFRNNNLVSLQHPDFGISDNVDPNGTIAVQRGIGVILDINNSVICSFRNNLPYAEALENGHSQQAPTGVYANAFHGVLQAYK